MTAEDSFIFLKQSISREKNIIREIESLSKKSEEIEDDERGIIREQIISLQNSLKNANEKIPSILEEIHLLKPLNLPPQTKVENNLPLKNKNETKKSNPLFNKNPLYKKLNLSPLEKDTLKRLKKGGEKKVEQKIKKPSKYINLANKIFSNISSKLSKTELFRTLEKDLVRSHLQFVPANYISTILFTTMWSAVAGIFIMLFFLFFNFGVDLPIITRSTEGIGARFLKTFWIILAAPIVTFLVGYIYPALEKKSLENKINQELPFAVIHMFAISGSLIDPSKIFSVLISTKEYAAIEREFTRLINEINVYGYDLVSALRSTAANSPSQKLSELLNGFATTITSGGDLREFFEKRAQTLLLDYRLEREKYTKSAETFMDIYISVVIAAPMILMLLLILIKISGLGLALSTGTITLIMVLGVAMINVLFLTFLYLKQPTV